MPTTWTDEQKSEALALYTEVGLAEAWRRTGIPKPTIASWARRKGLPHTDAASKTAQATEASAARAEKLRADLRVGLLEKAVDLLQRMDAEHVEFKGKDADQVTYPIAPAGAVQNYATSVGILIDKYRLEVGEATNRSESKTITDGLNDHEKQRLRDILDEVLAEADPGVTAS